MISEMFKNGVAYLIGAVASGAACVTFTLEALCPGFIKELLKALFN